MIWGNECRNEKNDSYWNKREFTGGCTGRAVKTIYTVQPSGI